ncbi:hypothetical protein LINPERHAP1_LOCUS33746 [Linum perenne]
MASLCRKLGSNPTSQLSRLLLPTRTRRTLPISGELPFRFSQPSCRRPLPRRRRRVPRRPGLRRGLLQADLRPNRQQGCESGNNDEGKTTIFVCQDADAVRREQRRRILRPSLLRRDDLPSSGLRRRSPCSDRGGEGRSRRGVEVPPHLPRDSAATSVDYRVERVRQPEEARRRGLDRLPPDRDRRSLRWNPPREARRWREERWRKAVPVWLGH